MSTDPDPSGRRAHDPYAALRHRDFLLFLLASAVATIGGEMQSVAVGWQLYEWTGSPLALGLVGLVQAVPVVLLVLPAGHVADRFPRKGIVIATQSLMAIASIGLAVASQRRGPIGLVYACLGLAGVASAFAFPARWAFLPQLVPTSVFGNAVTWRSSVWQVSAVLGPALGGYLLGQTRSPTMIYLVDAGCSVVVLAIVATIRGRPQERPAEPFSLDSLLAGVRFVRGTPLILAAITLDMFAVLLGGAVALLPVYAREILRVGPEGLGWLRTAPSLGAVSMALLLAHRPPLQRAGKALLWAVAGFGVATIIFGLSRDYRLSLVMLFLTGAFDNVSVVVRATLVQVLTPDAMRGRVSAVNSVFIGISNELGSFESGLAARLFGTVPAVVLGGIGTILVVLIVALVWPQVGQLGALEKLGRDDQAEPGLEVTPAPPLSVEGGG
ncbi:MAG: MFS transporter [Isosphaeraceae bacterium]|nr:MFS transporter [Isosphaeraceae bacterium]